ncbi:putative cobaltochelatase [Marinobacter nanhaiticus D15-8W]|nr:putative cobaltochelatase [Marinobacter nanhaiticus D15-8W]
MLYVDEVNLLPDTLVDLLLDAAARGINVVERDGLSHSHPARFSLIGTMNPDEGELRPQLLDRFGLCVELEKTLPAAQRIAVVQQREAFERDPEGFAADYADRQHAVTERIRAATDRLSSVVAEPWVYEHIASRCEAAQVEGLRADVTWHRAAQAHAAWRCDNAIEREDLDAVEEWVLAHRRNTPEEAPGNPPPPPRSDPSSRNGNPSSDTGNAPPESEQGQWGAMPPVNERTQAVPFVPNEASSRLQKHASKTTADRSGNTRKGRQLGRRSPADMSRKPDWFATLVANRGQWPLEQLKFQRNRAGQPIVHLVLLDTSGSTLGRRLFGRAKGLVQSLAKAAYGTRDQLAIMGFGNDQVADVLPRRRAPKDMVGLLDSLPGGGGTPLRDALFKAARTIRQWQRREPGLQIRTYLITDGRTRQSVSDVPALGECMVIDAEQSAVKRGRADVIAKQLGAFYQAFPVQMPFARLPVNREAS